jgi:hypothetical protein
MCGIFAATRARIFACEDACDIITTRLLATPKTTAGVVL